MLKKIPLFAKVIIYKQLIISLILKGHNFRMENKSPNSDLSFCLLGIKHYGQFEVNQMILSQVIDLGNQR